MRGDDAGADHGRPCRRSPKGARRARDAGLDGVELHGANGYLITQFLSSAINDRKDDYGGVLANRARFVREIVQAIRARVGRDFHLQMKISATEFNDALLPDEGPATRSMTPLRSAAGWWRTASTPFTCRPAAPSRTRKTRGRFPDRRDPQDLRQPDLQRCADAAQLPAVFRQADRGVLQAPVGERPRSRAIGSKA